VVVKCSFIKAWPLGELLTLTTVDHRLAEHDRVNTLIDEFDGWRQQAVAYGIAPQQLLRVVSNGRMLVLAGAFGARLH
jgi:hypothetical protein